jgi:hypothetical protein
MELNLYVAEKMAEARLGDLRAERARIARLAAARVRPRGIVRLRDALVRLRRRLAPGDPVAGRDAGMRVAR